MVFKKELKIRKTGGSRVMTIPDGVVMPDKVVCYFDSVGVIVPRDIAEKHPREISSRIGVILEAIEKDLKGDEI